MLSLLLGAAQRQDGGGDSGWRMDELDLLDWMADNGKQPGDDMRGFFDQEV